MKPDLLTGPGQLRGADLALLGGKLAGSTGSWLAGELAWDVRGGTLHGELSYTDLRAAHAVLAGPRGL